MSAAPLELAVLGDLHGCFRLDADGPLLARHPVRICTGDLTPNGGATRFDEALRQARELCQAGVHVILGNHDGPTCFTGRAFPKSYHALEEALGGLHVGARCIEFPELDLSLVGARPLSFGSTDDRLSRYPIPGHEGWDHARWARHISELLDGARASRIVILAHDGPCGLGDRSHDIYGCDFRAGGGDWGDPDLRAALDHARARGLPVVAVVAGHMHHAVMGGGQRARIVREEGILHLNAALVPRVTREGRALFVLRLEGQHATARLEWHHADGSVTRETLDP